MLPPCLSQRIKNCSKKRCQSLYAKIEQQVWDIYHATDRQDFFRQMADFQIWATRELTGPVLEAAHKLCAKADSFALAFDHPSAYRTSNMIDRHIIPLDRWLFASRHFHGNWSSLNSRYAPGCSFTTSHPTVPEPGLRNKLSHRLIDSMASAIMITGFITC